MITLSCQLFSQTGPGGVGTNDGTSSLVLWLDANTISGTTGSIITTWSDASGNGFDFTVGNGAVYNNPSVNGYPAFNFNGSSHYFERAFTAGITPANFTIFSATNVSTSGVHKAVISNRDDPAGAGTAGFILYSVPGSNNWEFWTGRASGSWQITTGGTSTAGNWASQMMDYQNIANGKELYTNGSIDGISTHSMTSNPSRPCRIGAGFNEAAPQYYFNGDIGEVIMFNTVINLAQKIIINNYLAAKYNYTLTSNDIYNKDDGANGNYDHEVAGIGRVDASNLHNDAQGTSILRIRNPSNLGNDEFLIWGHDNGSLVTTNLVDIPGTVEARFTRVWRASEVNSSSVAVDVGSIDIRWDLTNFAIGSTAASDLRLLVDTDNDGVFSDETPIAGATSLGGNIYQFAGVTAIANNLRFTLGTINRTLTPLPIELINFTAKEVNNDRVKLAWKTATEINNAYFTIERSTNANDWEIVKSVDGAGNSSTTLNYTTTDNEPYTGISYYRLKQTDFDGNFSYSDIRSVHINELVKSTIEIYPNPANNQITLIGNKNDLKSIIIYNVVGQNVTNQTIQKKINTSKMEIDISKLSGGTYYVKSTTAAFKIYKR